MKNKLKKHHIFCLCWLLSEVIYCAPPNNVFIYFFYLIQYEYTLFIMKIKHSIYRLRILIYRILILCYQESLFDFSKWTFFLIIPITNMILASGRYQITDTFFNLFKFISFCLSFLWIFFTIVVSIKKLNK